MSDVSSFAMHLHERFLWLVAAAYLIEGEPFSVENKRILTSIFEEDLFVQRRAQEISRLYGEDDKEVGGPQRNFGAASAAMEIVNMLTSEQQLTLYQLALQFKCQLFCH